MLQGRHVKKKQLDIHTRIMFVPCSRYREGGGQEMAHREDSGASRKDEGEAQG